MGKNKSLGVGSLSLLIFILALLVSYMNFNRKTLGDHISDLLHINIPEMWLTIALLILAIIVGRKFEDHLFARISTLLSQIFLGIFIITIVIAIILWLFELFS
ncbi:hypothetical protein ACFOZ1_14655 [Gracilibacillus marinus]|uniref:Uncharacterized protein n=1 Tax=Gracilibacillus marinus TaxID=630535 RepID=A0ABV8VZE3_9BACI